MTEGNFAWTVYFLEMPFTSKKAFFILQVVVKYHEVFFCLDGWAVVQCLIEEIYFTASQGGKWRKREIGQNSPLSPGKQDITIKKSALKTENSLLQREKNWSFSIPARNTYLYIYKIVAKKVLCCPTPPRALIPQSLNLDTYWVEIWRLHNIIEKSEILDICSSRFSLHQNFL